MGHHSATNARIDVFHVPVVIECHGSHSVSRFARFSQLCPQSLERISQLAGPLIPLPPSEPEVLTRIVSVDHGYVIRIKFQWPFNAILDNQRVMRSVLRISPFRHMNLSFLFIPD
jgi:hypothetical protein